jgi:hypothetical protein
MRCQIGYTRNSRYKKIAFRRTKFDTILTSFRSSSPHANFFQMDKASQLDLPTFLANEKIELASIKNFKTIRYETALKQISPDILSTLQTKYSQ